MSNSNFNHGLGPKPLIIATLFWIYRAFRNKLMFHNNIEIDSAEIGIQGQKIKIKPNYTNIDIAYKIWVELNTRKIGLAIDFDNDVIVEIYKSWYQFFGITREFMLKLTRVDMWRFGVSQPQEVGELSRGTLA